MQILWFTIVCLFVGFYEILLGFIGLVVIEWEWAKPLVDMSCLKGIRGKHSVWKSNNSGAEIFITLHIVMIMIYWTIYYIVFFIIPYKFNRIKKTSSEINKELKAKLKKKAKT